MHLLDAWTVLDPIALARLLGIPVAVLLAAFLPGRGIVRFAALAIATLVAMLGELAASPIVRAGWVVLWLLIAWRSGAEGVAPESPAPPSARRRGAIEAGMVALPLGVGMVALLLAALSREALAAPEARRASLGALLVGAGLVHLMLRRHVRRATVAFAALGLGLELLAATARAADVLHAGPPAGVALAGAAFASAVTLRVAFSRERWAGSPLVSDAHELHD